MRSFSDVDSVIHLAARAGGIQFQEEGAAGVFGSNRLITDNVLTAAKEHGVGKVFLASSLVTYRAASEPLTESHPLVGPADTPNPYAWSKITDEVVGQWHTEVETVVGRLGNVYGPGAPFSTTGTTVVHALIDRAARLGNGEDLVVWGDGTAVRSFVYVEDAAQAILVALTAGDDGMAYNIDSGQAVTIAELAETVRDQVNPTLRLVFDDSKPVGMPFRVGSINALNSRGYAPATGLEAGITSTVDWYRKEIKLG
jgi:GDP-L-fucose synthase